MIKKKMKLSEQVATLERDFEAFEKMYKAELENELAKTDIYPQNLTCSSISTHLDNKFYPMVISKTERGIGLILPIKRLIFHSLHGANHTGEHKDKERLEVLADLSKRRGYHLEYYDFAWQHGDVILRLMDGRLPHDIQPF